MNARVLEEYKDHFDFVSYGDDIGTQRTPLMRPELYRKLIKRFHPRTAAAVNRSGKWIIYHSCGSISSLIPDLLDVGFDALSPVQVAADCTSFEGLHRLYL